MSTGGDAAVLRYCWRLGCITEVVRWAAGVLQMTFIFCMPRKQVSKAEQHHKDLTVS